MIKPLMPPSSSPTYHLYKATTKKLNNAKMKLTLFSILALITVVMAAAQPQKAVIVSYPNDTPDSIVDQAKDAIVAAGGVITHEYKLIK